MKHSNNSFTYDDALNFIHGALKLGSKLGLSNIRELLKRLGNPQDRVQCIHVAGTNGKGTVTTSLAAVLSAAGYRVGAYTSPYVFRFNERIQVGGVEIDDDTLTQNTFRVREACAQMVAEGLAHPTEFEIVTAVGFLCFAEKECEYVVLEVGLGGRLDATNVIMHPLCTAITAIGFDHMQYLGNSLSEIAGEKCGILKEGVPTVVYGNQPEEALAVIRQSCKEKQAEMRLADLPHIRKADNEGTTFSAGGYADLFFPLAGEHMAKNACVTLEIIRVLREKGVAIPNEAVYEGFRKVRHRGRLETVAENPLFILDGAHNLDGIDALCRAVTGMFAGKKIVLIAGMLEDKEYEKAMEKTGGLGEELITVTVPSPRALPAEKLAEAAMPYHQNVTVALSIPEAVAIAYEKKPDVILAFGSLYMLGEVYEAVQEKNRV